ncbi:MAG: hypothetical protein U5R14_03415 [Gemmatimonadota bacterium]|nr:hypothetical protein [Gemmatimonadota bacterium]
MAPETLDVRLDVEPDVYTLRVEPDVYTLRVDRNIASAGSVFVSPRADTLWTEGASVTLTVMPEPGFRFSHWSGDASGDENPLDLVMDSDKAITAQFELAPPTLIAPSESAGTFTLEWHFDWPCPTTLCIGTTRDRYEVEESTTSPSEGFELIDTSLGRQSPDSLELTRPPGTYHYRVRAVDEANYGPSPYSAVRTVVVEDGGAATARIRTLDDGGDR